jgi:CheY-like chemotaxis protein
MARILVVDDDPQIRTLLAQTLEREGHLVVAASDGAQGVRLFREDPVDLIITDIIMPEKDGWEAIVELRKSFPETRIIAMSGGGELGPSSYLAIAKRFGAERIFSKPLKRQELLKAVRELLGNEQSVRNRGD